VLEFEISNESQREQAMRRMAERGATPIMATGFAQATTSRRSRRNSQAAVHDHRRRVKLPNVQAVLFKEQEGSFLVGMIAILTSKTGKVGFVGGMDIPLIRKFQCGYEQGAKYANPKAEVFVNMVGTTGRPWNDPARGGELARAQFAKGADVIFAAAGGTGDRRLPGRQGFGQVRDRRGQQPEPHPAGNDAHLDGEARRRRRVRSREEPPARRREPRASRKTASTTRSTSTTRSSSRRREEEGRPGEGRHHRRQDQGRRLHGGQRVQY
jgi:hypothetical protein